MTGDALRQALAPGITFAPASPFGFTAVRIGEGPTAINSSPSDVLLSACVIYGKW